MCLRQPLGLVLTSMPFVWPVRKYHGLTYSPSGRCSIVGNRRKGGSRGFPSTNPVPPRPRTVEVNTSQSLNETTVPLCIGLTYLATLEVVARTRDNLGFPLPVFSQWETVRASFVNTRIVPLSPCFVPSVLLLDTSLHHLPPKAYRPS